MPTPEEFISEYEDKLINGLELIESLSRYDRWIVEIEKLETGGFVPKIFEDEGKKIFLNLFSKPEYMDFYHSLFNEEIQNTDHILVSGHWIFQNLPTGIDYVSIDPDREHNIIYKKDQIQLLNEIGKLVEFDIPIQKWTYTISKTNTDKQEWRKIFLEREYYIIQNKSEIPLAPDLQSRKIFPVFVTKYAGERYILYLKNQQNKGDYNIRKIPGTELFPFLKKMELDGIVFNCLGPITPRAFQIGILDLLIADVT